MSHLTASKIFIISQWDKLGHSEPKSGVGEEVEGWMMSKRKIMLINNTVFLACHITLYSTTL